MSNEFLLRAFITFVFSISTAFSLRKKAEQKDDEKLPRFLPDISNAILPFFLLSLLIFGPIMEGTLLTLQMMLSICFTVFLHISIYYLLLSLMQPILRRYISAQACYMLWLIPNYLYLIFNNFMELNEPLFILKAPEKTVWFLFSLWFIGFVLVLSWKIVSHLFFRYYILKDAKPIRHLDILKCWRDGINYVRPRYKDYHLVSSTKITTPLSIGLFHRTIYIVLPDRNYSNEELILIFRHELIHISREDIWTKFFLTFCTAVCWFNPLMWFAMKRSAEDIELTCDQFALENSTEEERRIYASLILKTAGDERGFTTCLSASAKALRYRLANIVNAKKTYSGTITVGIMTFLLFMSCGYISLAYGSYTGENLIYQNEDSSLYIIDHISNPETNYRFVYDNVDVDALHEYLSNLKCTHLTGNYSFSDNRRELFIDMNTPEGDFLWITLSDRFLTLWSPSDDKQNATYYLEEQVDWEYLDSIWMEYPAIEISFYDKDNLYNNKIQPTLYEVLNHRDEIIYRSELAVYEVNGIYGDITSQFTKAVLDFSKSPVGPYSITVISQNDSRNDAVKQEISPDSNILSLPGYPAHYIITVDFQNKDGKICTAEYRFILEEFQ